MVAQNSQKDISPANPVMNTTLARIRYFTQMNISVFLRFKSKDDLHEFLYYLQKVNDIIGITPSKSADLDTYQL